MIDFRLANNLQECTDSYELARNIFSHNTADPDYKTLLWDMNGNFHPQQLMLAIDQSKVIGLVRMIPTKLAWREYSYSLMGLSSICVEPSYQGKSVGRNLMETTVKHCDAIGVNASYLVARHAVDHFYTKFGFVGSSSYPQITINHLELVQSDNINLTAYNSNNHSSYLDFYNHAYSESLKLARKEPDFWQNSFKRLAYLGLSFHEIWNQNELIGYVLLTEDYIDEIAFADSANNRIILASLNKLQEKFSEKLILRVPHQHKIVASLTFCDVLFMSRQCLYGGHMLRWNKPNPKELSRIIIGAPNTPEDRIFPTFALSKLDEI